MLCRWLARRAAAPRPATFWGAAASPPAAGPSSAAAPPRFAYGGCGQTGAAGASGGDLGAGDSTVTRVATLATPPLPWALVQRGMTTAAAEIAATKSGGGGGHEGAESSQEPRQPDGAAGAPRPAQKKKKPRPPAEFRTRAYLQALRARALRVAREESEAQGDYTHSRRLRYAAPLPPVPPTRAAAKAAARRSAVASARAESSQPLPPPSPSLHAVKRHAMMVAALEGKGPPPPPPSPSARDVSRHAAAVAARAALAALPPPRTGPFVPTPFESRPTVALERLVHAAAPHGLTSHELWAKARLVGVPSRTRMKSLLAFLAAGRKIGVAAFREPGKTRPQFRFFLRAAMDGLTPGPEQCARLGVPFVPTPPAALQRHRLRVSRAALRMPRPSGYIPPRMRTLGGRKTTGNKVKTRTTPGPAAVGGGDDDD